MNLNDATREQLELVGQIDGERAQYLIDYRTRSGRFESWDDVKRVPSYEEGMVERLQAAGYTVGAGTGRAEHRSEGRADSRERRPRAADHSHSINAASAEQLEQTHMIDGERARRIIGYRDQHGPFSDWHQVKEVSGIDDGIVDRLKESGFRVE